MLIIETITLMMTIYHNFILMLIMTIQKDIPKQKLLLVNPAIHLSIN